MMLFCFPFAMCFASRSVTLHDPVKVKGEPTAPFKVWISHVPPVWPGRCNTWFSPAPAWHNRTSPSCFLGYCTLVSSALSWSSRYLSSKFFTVRRCSALVVQWTCGNYAQQHPCQVQTRMILEECVSDQWALPSFGMQEVWMSAH